VLPPRGRSRPWCDGGRKLLAASLFEQGYSVIVPTTLSARMSPIRQRNSQGEIDVSPVRRQARDNA